MNKPSGLALPKLAILATLLAIGIPAHAQVAGPIAPPPKFEVKRLPAKPDPGAPPLPADEIIHRFMQNEDLIKKAYETGSIDQTVKVEELADHGGQFTFTGQEYPKPDGQRYERVVKPPVSNLRFTEFSLEDVKTLGGFPLFFLTTDQAPLYKLSYEGEEKLDQINTLIFRVQPKTIGHKPLFDGVIWIDNQDFAIVKSYGQFVTDAGGAVNGFPFTMFETYRENLTGHLWFPTYIRSDGEVKTPKGSVPIRLVVRSENFKEQPSVPLPVPPKLAKQPPQD
ncbi:MAG TPA: hypothetical protein VJN90_11385 [Candidatus Acidoferrales bacterium]|nr:hypothetical protein [Candidatus Acidoferrales bacterium]